MVFKSFDMKIWWRIKANVSTMLAQELQKPFIEKFKKGKCMRGNK